MSTNNKRSQRKELERQRRMENIQQSILRLRNELSKLIGDPGLPVFDERHGIRLIGQ